MANLCDTTYQIIGNEVSIKKLHDYLSDMAKGSVLGRISMFDIYENLGFKKDYYRRGMIYDVTKCNDNHLSIHTETAWDGCHELIKAMVATFDDGLDVAYIEVENGMCIYNVHNTDSYDFDAKYYVNAWDDEQGGCCDDYYPSLPPVIESFCEMFDYDRGDRTDEEMLKVIKDYKFEDGSYFYVNEFVFV